MNNVNSNGYRRPAQVARRFEEEMRKRGYSPDSSYSRIIFDSLPDIFQVFAIAYTGENGRYATRALNIGRLARGRAGFARYTDRTLGRD